MQIFVKIWTGEAITVDVEPSNMVEIVKGKIGLIVLGEACLGNARLVFGGKCVDDGRTLEEYDIRRESTLHMVLRLRGC